MKRSLAVTACLVVVCLLALPLAAAAGTEATHGASWTGWVTDEACGAKGNVASHAGCAKKCAERGTKLVFFNNADQKIYKLDNQDLAKQHAGEEVTLKGKLEGDAITVESIDAAPAGK